jgi:hypothetical protein
MARRPRLNAGVRRLERSIEAALAPGEFIGRRSAAEFVTHLEEVAATIKPSIRSAPAQAAALYEAFLAGCREKAAEVDDSSGELGRFAKDLVCGWVCARQAMGADPDETARLLVARQDDDPYAFMYEIEDDLAKALARPGLAAFERIAKKRWEEALAARDRKEPGRELTWRNGLKAIYQAQRDAARYAEVCARTETTSGDCERLASIATAKRRPEDALAWAERGLALEKKSRSGAGAALGELRLGLLVKLGRPEEARAAAWQEFVDHPHSFTYRDLMRHVSRADRPRFHGRAMEVADSANLDDAIGLWLETREIGRLAERLKSTPAATLEGLSHYVTEPAARRLSKTHPVIAAAVYAALGMRILGAGKSRYYVHALDHLLAAKRCYRAAQHQESWDQLLARVRHDHHRKSGFQAALEERLARDERPKGSWLEGARKRWTPRP